MELRNFKLSDEQTGNFIRQYIKTKGASASSYEIAEARDFVESAARRNDQDNISKAELEKKIRREILEELGHTDRGLDNNQRFNHLLVNNGDNIPSANNYETDSRGNIIIPENRQYQFNINGKTDRDAANRYLIGYRDERWASMRSLQVDNDSKGGMLVQLPAEMGAEYIRKLNELNRVRSICRKFQCRNALGFPAVKDQMGDAEWTSEIKSGSEDTTLDFDARVFTPHPLARRIKVSKTLLRAGAISPEEVVFDELAKAVQRPEENAFCNGDGQGKPLGIFTNSAQGITSAQDISAGNTITSVTMDGLINCMEDLPTAAENIGGVKPVWLWSKTLRKQCRKLKDGNGTYHWTVDEGYPNYFLGYEIVLSDYVPTTFTTGLYVGAFFNPMLYWIVDSLTLSIDVATELYMESHQNGYFVRQETDGMPVTPEGFRRIKLA